MGKLIITGVNGFIGSALAEFFKRRFHVVGIGRDKISKVKGIQYCQKDLISDDITELLKTFLPDFFIHCAGIADVSYSIKYPDNDLFNSVVMTERILYQILCTNVKCKFLYLSSAAVYGDPERLPIDENALLNPISPYALHKQLTENICLYFIKQYNMNIKILRIFSAYGIGLKKQLLWDIGEKVIQTQAIELYGSGEESRDYIYISDLIDAIFCVMNDNFKNSGEVYNIASGIEIKIKDIAFLFAKEWGITLDAVRFNGISKIGNPINWQADISKLLKLGFRPKVTIEKGIEAYVKWFKSINHL